MSSLRAVRGCLARGVARRTGAAPDAGNAIVEFLGAAVILMIPAFYLIIMLARVQAAVFATQGAAQDAGRVLSAARSYSDGIELAQVATEVALADQGFDVDPVSVLSVACSTVVCLAPGSEVSTTVRVEVALPGLGGTGLPLTVPVSATVVTPVDRYKEAPR